MKILKGDDVPPSDRWLGEQLAKMTRVEWTDPRRATIERVLDTFLSFDRTHTDPLAGNGPVAPLAEETLTEIERMLKRKDV